MKVLPIILLNLATVVIALVLYDTVQSEPEPGFVPAPAGNADYSALERRVERLTREVEELRALRPEPREPGVPFADLAERAPGLSVDDPDAAGAILRAMVDDAVEEKARAVNEERRVKADKRPTIDAFATVLELSDSQRASVEQEVIRAQHEAYAILETPTENGRDPMSILVELRARNMADPGKDAGYQKWAAWLRAEKVPGSNETYRTRVDAVKASLADGLRQVLGEGQFEEFRAWKLDPINIRGIPGSPLENLRLRIEERARTLGATIPEKRDR